MGLKFDKVDDLDKMFEKFAKDPDKLAREKVQATISAEDEEKRKKDLGIVDKTREEQKILK